MKINNVSEYGQYLTQMDKLIEQALANVPVENTMIIVTAEHGLTFNTLSKKERENYLGVIRFRFHYSSIGKAYLWV
ncbi:Uncharacterised protein [Rodentibacter pneumotropicus]|uniref:Uncharacterized protein n=1 Tax=Rodentibacter pneumotropicus TaxID=758 RepID=A0A448ML35_9PAST|nr:Uncharacterised protein [Rodentibacter pneumotropicus]